MRESIRLKTEDFYFKFRVAGLVVKNNKILFVEMDNNGYYCLPGGYVEVGETTEDAVIREFKEETGKDVKILGYMGILENYFITKSLRRMHEISCYYLVDFVDDVPTTDFSLIENDNGYIVKLDFKWIDINELDNYVIKPKYLCDVIKSRNLEFKHMVLNNLI